MFNIDQKESLSFHKNPKVILITFLLNMPSLTNQKFKHSILCQKKLYLGGQV